MPSASLTKDVFKSLEDNILTQEEIAEQYNIVMQQIYDGRNFSQRLGEEIEVHPDYIQTSDTLKGYTRFLQEKIYACFGGAGAPPENDSKYDAWAKQAGTDTFTAPPTRIIKSWLTLNNYDKNVHYLDHSEKGRDYMFLLCFALGLGNAQAKFLFDKVFIDRFLSRRAQDILFYYCLRQGLPYHTVFTLWNKLESLPAIDPVTTQTMQNNLPTTEQEALLLARSMQSLDPLAQKQRILDMIDMLKQQMKDRWQAEEAGFAKQEQTLQAGAKLEDDITEEKYHAEKLSDETLFKRFFPCYDDACRDLSLSGNAAALKQEESFLYVVLLFYKACPTLDDLQNRKRTQDKASFYTLRNLFILLHFFVFHTTPENDKRPNRFKVYTREANQYLKRFGLPELYLCNPYDFVFLQAAAAAPTKEKTINKPIDVFHTIVDSIFIDENAEEDV